MSALLVASVCVVILPIDVGVRRMVAMLVDDTRLIIAKRLYVMSIRGVGEEAAVVTFQTQ